MTTASAHRSGGPPELSEMARAFAKDSIVCQATAQLIEQVLLEVHETQIVRLREALRIATVELAALIPNPSAPKITDWPVQNPADAACLQTAYEAVRAYFAESTPTSATEGAEK